LALGGHTAQAAHQGRRYDTSNQQAPSQHGAEYPFYTENTYTELYGTDGKCANGEGM
jgi:hypothetical protein